MLRVVLARFFFRDGQLRADFLALDLLDQHPVLQLLPQIVDRHVLRGERLLEFRLVLQPLFLADVVDDLPELLVRHLVAELLAVLEQEQLVDRVHQDLRRDVGQHLFQLRVVLQHLRVDLPVHALAERGDLALLEFGLADDVAVHLHEDRFDDVGARPRDG